MSISLSVDINLYASGPREWSRRDHGPATLALSNYSRVCTDPSRFARLVVTSSHEQFRGILLPREEEKKREREREREEREKFSFCNFQCNLPEKCPRMVRMIKIIGSKMN